MLIRRTQIRHARVMYFKRAPSRNSTNYRADNSCVNLVCEYFCWMPGDPYFLFGRSLPFQILSIILKYKKKYVPVRGKFWYMDTGVRDLEATFFLTLIL